MNRWINPPIKKYENEVYLTIPAIPDKPFEYYLEQVGKKKVVNSKKSIRIAEKSVSLAERIGMQGDK